MRTLKRCGVAGMVIGVWLVCVAWPGFAQVRVEFSSPATQAKPDDFVTVVLTLFNDAPQEQTLNLTFIFPKGISALGAPSSRTLGAQTSEALFLTVLVSRQARSGENRITVRVRSQSDPTQTAGAVTSIDVLQAPGLTLQAPAPLNAEVDQTLTLTFLISNAGNAMDQVAFSVEIPSGVDVELGKQLLGLLPGETQTLTVKVTISNAVPPGPVRVVLTAASTLFANTRASATAKVTLLPLLPQDVPGRLVLEVPSTLSATARVQGVNTNTVFTNALSGFANFNQKDVIRYRLTLDNFTVRTLGFELDRALLGTRLGLISIAWSALLSMDGAGAQLTLKQLPFVKAFSVGALVNGLLPQIGAQETLTLFGMDVSIEHMLRFNSDVQHDVLHAVTLKQQLGSALTLSSEWALSDREGIRDLGVILRTVLDLAPFGLQTDFVRVGSDFVGNRADEQGVTLTQTFERTDVTINSAFSRFQNNVNALPSVTPQLRTSLQTNARWAPKPPLPSLFVTVNFGALQTGSEVTSNLVSTLRINEALGDNASSGAFLQHSVNVDSLGVGVSQLETFSYGINLVWVSVPLTAQLSLTQLTQTDALLNKVVDQTFEAAAGLTLRSPLASLALNASRLPSSLVLGAVLDAALGPLDASAQLNLDLQDNGNVGFDAQAQLSLRFDAPIAFVPIRGRVQGTVFSDDNDNGVQDAGEAGVPDIVLAIGDAQARTDADGFYRSPPLEPGSYEIKFKPLPLTLVALDTLPQKLDLVAGQTATLDLRLARVALIEGALFNDQNQDGKRAANEPGVGGVRVLLSGPGVDMQSVTGSEGAFSFKGLVPGSYTVTLDVSALPPRFEPTTPVEVSVTLSAGERTSIAFGAFQRPQAILFVPTADFTVDPSRPSVGQTVTFDASASFDPDGQVVAYAWDFDGDGQPEATGAQASFVYNAAGTFEVTLTVTDNDGNEDSVTRSLEVVSAK